MWKLKVKKKEYNNLTAKQIIALATAGVSQEKIAEFIPGVIRDDIARDGGLYREDWELGRSTAAFSVCETYFKMANSGKHWYATKQYMAHQLGVIEPKAPDVVIQRPPNIMIEHVRGKAKLIEPEIGNSDASITA